MKKFTINLSGKSVLLAFLILFGGGYCNGLHANEKDEAGVLQGNIRVTGVVKEANGEPIVGVSIKVVGTNVGTSTNVDGNFQITVPNAQSKLEFRYLGLETQVVTVGNQTNLTITMQEDATLLDEVVVVGYGTQRKTTLTGSVSQVTGDEVLKGKATTNMAAALQGTIPGLTVTRTSSRPGSEDTKLTVRGGISVNSSDPMIVIDGMEGYSWDLSQINPNDVESISVLKDAAAAIYGTRAGAGVILITTKRGKEGKPKFTYNGSVHNNYIGKRFPVADGQTWAEMLVHATTNDAYAYLKDGQPQWNWWMWPEDVWKTLAAGQKYEGALAGTYRFLDPSVDQFDAVYGNTWGQSHNVTVNGGNDKLQVVTSLGYANDRSLVDVVYDGQKKYNFRMNADYKINDFVKTSFNTSYDQRTVSTPMQGVGHGIQDFYVFPLYNEYGQFYDTFGNNNLIAKLVEGGTKTNTEEIFRLAPSLTIDLNKVVKGLSLTGSANFRIRNHKMIERQTQVTMYDWSGETKSSTGQPDYSLTSGAIKSQTADNDRWVKNTLEDQFYQLYSGLINYNRSFGVHNVALVAGATAEKTGYNKYYQFRKNMLIDELDDINLGDATTAEATGGSNETGMISYLGRLNYDYKGTYLIEGLYRRDGSSKFNKDNRWANFGGVSGGIRVSEWDFVKSWNIFNNLKLRASYGETGSQTGIGNYDYISSIGKGTTIFGYNGTKVNTAWVAAMTSTDRTWERIATTNYAIDFTVLNNRLSGTAEYFIRENNGMLISMAYPQTLGATAPKTNSGDFQAKGWELSLSWRDKIGEDFHYNASFILSDADTEVTSYPGAQKINNGSDNNRVGGSSFQQGKPLNAIYVYKTDGYLQTVDEVNEYYKAITQKAGGIHPVQNTTSQLTPGCVKRVDVNEDGRITTDDMIYYGDANSHYSFGLNLGASYKAFDFSMFVQGVGQQYVVREGTLNSPWNAGYTNQNVTFWGNTWTQEHTDARYPIMSRDGNRNNWNYKQFNDINVNNTWYARAKTLMLGYTLPKAIINKIGVDKLRFYLSGENLFEVSNVKDGFDPESKPASGQGNVDVYARTLSFGIDLTF